jgi:hypothetical protein
LCVVHLTGRYNGTEFEDRDVTLIIGEASEVGVVDGVEQALKKFKNGEKSLLQVKAQYAYGADGNATYNIPPNADIEYEVELKKFEKVLGFSNSLHFPSLQIQFAVMHRRIRWTRVHYANTNIIRFKLFNMHRSLWKLEFGVQNKVATCVNSRA